MNEHNDELLLCDPRKLTEEEARRMVLFRREDGTLVTLADATQADWLEYRQRLDARQQQLRKEMAETNDVLRKIGLSLD